MRGQEFILLFILHFGGVSTGTFYHTAGDNVTLACNSRSSLSPCSNISWLYNSDINTVDVPKVKNGKVLKEADRLKVDSNCSLIITSIAAEDAGLYKCQHGGNSSSDGHVLLNILTVYPSSPCGDPTKGGACTLECSLWKHQFISNDSLQWVDERETVLLTQKCRGQEGCSSLLTEKHHSEGSRRYTCKYFEGNSMKIEYNSTLVLRDPVSDQHIIIIVAVMVVVVVAFLTAIFIKSRRRTRVPKDDTKITNIHNPTHHTHQHEEVQYEPTYVTVDHAKSKACHTKKVKVDVEPVTYSAVRIKEDVDPNTLYSSITGSR
ncbi:uncharacterized protein LOC105937459 isoform X2 [Fundulus heteroclitus]|uniref:uncharacterized protein LOC105937459 isoform X2 n=1 Tax=Fundulus heteroclitus TaxID=8078 RepID=UPI00165B76E9|nr:uncharacterized protein LOC105937459 isoform X2 [Fundulus heteroclitus]